MGESRPDPRGKELLMDENLKRGVAGTLVCTITAMTVVPHLECGSQELCEIKRHEQPHIEQSSTGGISDTGVRPVIVATSTDGYEVVQPTPSMTWRI